MLPRSAPTIDELLADGLIRAVMRADRVEPGELKRLLDDVARRVVPQRAPRPGPSFAIPRLEWRRDADPNASAVPLPAAIANACGPGLCC